MQLSTSITLIDNTILDCFLFYGLNLVLVPNTTHELKAFTIKHHFAQGKKKFYPLNRIFSFEEIKLLH